MPPRTRRFSAVARVGVALSSGLATALAFPGYDLWWMAFVGTAALSVAVLGTRWRLALLLGLVHGLAFFLPTLSWSGVFVGRVPWFALATLQALYLAAMTAVAAPLAAPFARAGLRPLAYAVLPLLWLVQEAARGATPWGGFPWARLAYSQADTPLADVAAFAGAPGVTFSVAALGALLHAGAAWLWRRRSQAPGEGALADAPAAYPLLAGALALVALLPVGLGLAWTPPTDGRKVPVVLVQGNVPRAGLDFNAERRKVLDNHVAGTLAAKERLGGTRPTLVVWPENASDIDPTRNPDAYAVIQTAVAALDAPVLVGALLEEPEPNVSNASLLYRPGGGDPERYVKQHPVPFAEYIPYRSFFRRLNDKVDYVSRDFVAGDRAGSFEIPVPGQQPYWVLPTICFEVAYDGLMRTSTLQPGREASILAVQTNNATFGYTAESEQQFAISRIRAIEHGRSVVHVSTVGVSAFINPDGTYVDKTTLFTAATQVGMPVVRTQVTVADRVGAAPVYAAGLASAALLAAGLWLRRRDARVRCPKAPHRRKERAVV